MNEWKDILTASSEEIKFWRKKYLKDYGITDSFLRACFLSIPTTDIFKCPFEKLFQELENQKEVKS